MFTFFDKAIVALLVPIITGALAMVGIPEDMTVGELVPYILMGIATAVSVYIVPNKK